LIGIFGAADFGIKNFVAAIIHNSNTNKKRGSNFANLLVDGKITVREKGKRYIIGLFKILIIGTHLWLSRLVLHHFSAGICLQRYCDCANRKRFKQVLWF
jgi:hypothetical protein